MIRWVKIENHLRPIRVRRPFKFCADTLKFSQWNAVFVPKQTDCPQSNDIAKRVDAIEWAAHALRVLGFKEAGAVPMGKLPSRNTAQRADLIGGEQALSHP